jgi:uncharacterized protein (TIGR02266 family)
MFEGTPTRIHSQRMHSGNGPSDAFSDPADRRREQRIPARIEVRFREPAQAARALRAYSLNFSVGGLCLKTQKQYALGQKLLLDVQVEARQLSVVAEVAWVRGGAIGVRFSELSPEDRAALEQLVAQLKK